MVNQERSIMSKQGFYTKIGGNFIGVFLSSEGPKLFVNKEIYELTSPHWDVEMIRGRSRQMLTFYWKGEVKLSVQCEAEQDLFLPLFDYLLCRPQKLKHA
ncbi:hypothetical protein SAMN02799630_00791 [Paenibacillus sp. UNCCL117]|uniref:hypothetical protein n=1 Tax=unclassified Paenibacillus TaxID=185978 RepID=UPI0008842701|nr:MULTISPECIES: hypothetical protein [unclassified Paenibacillus]SDC20450.1 hypothetical protein SAMN04488602_101591 [Paenibacillus sp. cl123]SFW18628.1 hypothetical protein SAMN02799630_00791 [Paenibacillus sp. UNCCL117]